MQTTAFGTLIAAALIGLRAFRSSAGYGSWCRIGIHASHHDRYSP
jgi:hypothetical protein